MFADPDSLATRPEVRRLAALPRPWEDEDYPDWESLEYVACTISEQRPDIDGDIRDVLTDERGIQVRMDPNPDDAAWAHLSSAEVSRHNPRLWTLFGEHWTSGTLPYRLVDWRCEGALWPERRRASASAATSVSGGVEPYCETAPFRARTQR